MTDEPDDPRLTAYALGELNEAEWREIEANLKEDPDARRIVEEIRAAADVLEFGLKNEKAPSLSAAQRGKIGTIKPLPALKRSQPATATGLWPGWKAALGGVAALLAVSVLTFAVMQGSPDQAKVAYNSAPRKLEVSSSSVKPLNARLPLDQAKEWAANDHEVKLKYSDYVVNAEEVDAKSLFANPGDHFEMMEIGGGGVGGAVLLEDARGVTSSDAVGHGSGSGGGKGAGHGSWGRVDSLRSIPPSTTPPMEEFKKRANAQDAFGVPEREYAGKKYGFDKEKATGDSQAPLNPLGYKETGERDRWRNELRYAPPRYHSYLPPVYTLPASSEEYARIHDNAYRDTNVLENRLSTFAVDVDTASYSNVRRFLKQGQMPPADAVRVEEMVNYFKYDYSAPSDGKPFHVFMELAQCPWNPNHKLARVGIKAAEIQRAQRPASNLVFLIDVSGSMGPANRLPLVKQGLTALVNQLDGHDRVSIVTYATGANVVLRSIPCGEQQKKAILQIIADLRADGSTNGGDGIQQAYAQAASNFIRGGVNRVILATDGDFNVGITDRNELVRMIEEKAKSGVFLTVLGYGMGNIKDATLEQLANKGNGNYAYIDDEKESQRVLIEQMSGTLVTVAKDVKIQVEFNPARVRAHRLVGYENRALAHQDFNNDAKDAGEIGAGHTVTALYEIIPTRGSAALPGVDPLKYLPAEEAARVATEELLNLKIRYKLHNQDTSSLLEFPIADNAVSYAKASKDFKFAAAVASFGMLLRGSQYRGCATFDSVMELAGECVNGVDERKEFMELVRTARDRAQR